MTRGQIVLWRCFAASLLACCCVITAGLLIGLAVGEGNWASVALVLVLAACAPYWFRQAFPGDA